MSFMTIDHGITNRFVRFDLPVTSQVTEKGPLWVLCDWMDKDYLLVFELFRWNCSLLKWTSAILIWSKFDLLTSLWRHRSPKKVNVGCFVIEFTNTIDRCLNRSDAIIHSWDRRRQSWLGQNLTFRPPYDVTCHRNRSTWCVLGLDWEGLWNGGWIVSIGLLEPDIGSLKYHRRSGPIWRQILELQRREVGIQTH